MWAYKPNFFLNSGLIQTIYVGLWAGGQWEKTVTISEPDYQEYVFQGADNVPIYALYSIPDRPRGTIIATYGITGTVENQWFLRIWGRKAYAQGYAVVLFDWRAHGKTALLSPNLTSDGLYEGRDFIHIANQAQKLGFPPRFWFTGYSLGGKLALWALYEASNVLRYGDIDSLSEDDIGGGCVICPSLDAFASLNYLENHPIGRFLEKAITRSLKKLAEDIYQAHPDFITREQIDRVNSIQEFDQYLVIPQLGFTTVAEYYQASSPLNIMPLINKPTLILYAMDDPMFAPSLIENLSQISRDNSMIDLILTSQGGHVGYISSKKCQRRSQDLDRWWAWNRCLEWIDSRNQDYQA